MFPEPQKLKNYEFLKVFRDDNLEKTKFAKKTPKFSQGPKMLKKQFKHIKQQKIKKNSKNQKESVETFTKNSNITKIMKISKKKKEKDFYFFELS